jgi:hypothetical protein
VRLPVDEADAWTMLAEGSLDPVLWEAIQPYYVAPLNVAAGELAVLVELFPELTGPLPLAADTLRRYEPWEAGDVQRLFADYPELVPFAPLLSFEGASAERWGDASVRLRRAATDGLQRQYASFRVTPCHDAEAEGRVSFASTGLRWQRRSCRLDVPAVGSVRIGNYTPFDDDGLFLGHFPRTGDTIDGVEQFLYGAGGMYNGACWDRAVAKRSRVEAFYHHGAAEQAGAVRASAGVTSWLSLQSGVSLLSVGGSGGAEWAVHGGLSVRWPQGSLALGTCATECGGGRVPLNVALDQAMGAARAGLRLVWAPRGYAAPRSRIMATLTDQSDSALAADTWLLELSTRYPLGRFVACAPSVRYLCQGGSSRAQASLVLVGSVPADYTLRYVYEPSLGAQADATTGHTVALDAQRDITEWLGVTASARWYLRTGAYQSLRLALAPRFAVGAAVVLRPSVVYQWRTAQSGVTQLSLQQELQLSQAASGACAVQVPCVQSGWKETVFDVTIRLAL